MYLHVFQIQHCAGFERPQPQNDPLFFESVRMESFSPKNHFVGEKIIVGIYKSVQIRNDWTVVNFVSHRETEIPKSEAFRHN